MKELVSLSGQSRVVYNFLYQTTFKMGVEFRIAYQRGLTAPSEVWTNVQAGLSRGTDMEAMSFHVWPSYIQALLRALPATSGARLRLHSSCSPIASCSSELQIGLQSWSRPTFLWLSELQIGRWHLSSNPTALWSSELQTGRWHVVLALWSSELHIGFWSALVLIDAPSLAMSRSASSSSISKQ